MVIFTSLQIMASHSFIFKQVHDIYSCKILYTEKYFHVIAELESNDNFPKNNIYKNSFNVWNRHRIHLHDQNIKLY